MVYLIGKKISDNLLLRQGLIKIYGIGNSNAEKICKYFGFLNKIRVKNLSQKNWSNILKYIRKKKIKIEKDLKKKLKFNISNLISIRNYRGMRHSKGLSVRGQRTHTNAKTQKKLYNSRLLTRNFSTNPIILNLQLNHRIKNQSFVFKNIDFSKKDWFISFKKCYKSYKQKLLFLNFIRTKNFWVKSDLNKKYRLKQNKKYFLKNKNIFYLKSIKSFNLKKYLTIKKSIKFQQISFQFNSFFNKFLQKYKLQLNYNHILNLNIKTFLFLSSNWPIFAFNLLNKKLKSEFKKLYQSNKRIRKLTQKYFKKSFKLKKSSIFDEIKKFEICFNDNNLKDIDPLLINLKKNSKPFKNNIKKMIFKNKIRKLRQTKSFLDRSFYYYLSSVNKLNFTNLYINTKYNNFFVFSYNSNGKLLFWASGSSLNLKGKQQGSRYAGKIVTDFIILRLKELKIKFANIIIKGVGPARKSALLNIRKSKYLRVLKIIDSTPIPFNGCRVRKIKR